MSINERSLANLQTQKYLFSADNPARNAGRKPGIPNRKTIISQVLDQKITVKDLVTGEDTTMTVELAIVAAQAAKAIHGMDTNAAHLLLDGKYGKVAPLNEQPDTTGPDLSGMSEAQLRKIAYARRLYMEAIAGNVDSNDHIQEAEVVPDK